MVALLVLFGISFFFFYLVRIFGKPVTLEEMVAQNPPVAEKPAPKARVHAPQSPPRRFMQEFKAVTLEEVQEYSQSVPELSISLERASSTEVKAEGGEAKVEEPSKGESTQSSNEDEKAGQGEPKVNQEEPNQKEPKPEAKASEKTKAQSPEASKEERKKVEEGASKQEPIPPQRNSGYLFKVYAAMIKVSEQGEEAEKSLKETKDRLIELGFKPTVEERKQGDTKYYFVCVGGPFDNYDVANAVKKKLKDAGFPDAYILRKPRE